MTKSFATAITSAVLLTSVLLSHAASTRGTGTAPGDWPQWRGPDRNDVSRETGLLKQWPEGGPKLVWTYRDAGVGFSGPSMVGDRLFSMGTGEEKEFVFALDRNTGKELWKTEIGPRLKNRYGDGPRGTPTVDDGLVYAIGGRGDLVCLDAATGNEVWHKSLTKDFRGGVPGWGYTESPLVDGDVVVCTPGGNEASIVALHKKTGVTIWTAQGMSDAAQYSSIIIGEIGGVKQYIQLTHGGVVGVSAKDGQFLWRSERHARITAAIPTPIFHAGKVYSAAGYGSGCVLLNITASGAGFEAETVWDNKNMTNMHGGVILVGKHLYGYSQGKGWCCQDFETGELVWSDRKSLRSGAVTYADGHLYCYSEDEGTAVLVEASPEGWKEHGRFTIPEYTQYPRQNGHIWTHPVVAGGRLHLRDNELVFCYDVKSQ